MSFAIEVPGEAQPLSPDELFVALRDATSSTTPAPRRQAVGQQLSSWEFQQGYYSSLQVGIPSLSVPASRTELGQRQTLFLNKTLPYEVRLLAIIQLKNGIDRYWRIHHQMKGAVTADEKTFIRSRLFQGTVEEENTALALHNALAVAKTIRIDYQQHWPDALPSLTRLLRAHKDGDQRHLNGALQLVLRVVKEMTTARLRTSQTALQGITPELSYLLAEMYSAKAALWVGFLGTGQGDKDAAELAMLNSLFCVRII